MKRKILENETDRNDMIFLNNSYDYCTVFTFIDALKKTFIDVKAHLLVLVLEPFIPFNVVNLFWNNERMSEMFEKCRASTLPRPRPRTQGSG